MAVLFAITYDRYSDVGPGVVGYLSIEVELVTHRPWGGNATKIKIWIN